MKGCDEIEEEFGRVAEAYEREFGRPIVLPFGIALSEITAVHKAALEAGKSVSEDYDWYKDVPDDAMV